MGEETGSSNLPSVDRESTDDVNREVQPPLQAALVPFDIPVPLAAAAAGPLLVVTAATPPAIAVPPAIAPTYNEAEMVEAVQEKDYSEDNSELVVDSFNPFPSIPTDSCLVVTPISTMPHSEADELARGVRSGRAYYCNSIT